MPQSYDILSCLKDNKCKEFIINNIDGDVQKLALKHHGKVDFDLRTALDYISLHQKARKKLPELCAIMAAMTDRSYQQSSSENVARYRADLLTGRRILDLTGGLGVDAIALGSNARNVLSCDPDKALNELVRHNLEALNINNIERVDSTAEEMDLKGFDWIYIDPDRRTDDGRRVLGLEDMRPHIPTLMKRMPNDQAWAIKLSPLFDLEHLLKSLPEVKRIHVISEENEVKEILAISSPKMREQRVAAVNLGKHPYLLEMNLDERIHAPAFQDPPAFLYLPMAALLKSGLAGSYAAAMQFVQLNPFHVYGSDTRQRAVGFVGMEVLHRMPPSIKKWKRYIKERGVSALRIHAKGHARKGAYWAQQLGVKEGGEDYLVLLFDKEPMGYYCRLLL